MALEKRGVPTVTLATSEFLQLSRLQARAMGFAELRVITIEHPLGGVRAEQALEKVEGAAEAVSAMILQR